MSLNDIPVHAASIATGNLRPVLHEIRHALSELIAHGTHGMIDLHSLPFSPQEYAELDEFLGEGEIDLTLNVLGKTRLRESGYAGVWRIEHFDGNDKRIGYFIEIGHVPEILRSQCDDIKEGLAAMTTILAMEEDTNEDANT
ncbi:MAG: hydrogenase expression/formation C-terminal domain-containing protein [Candidatus Thiothrix putei]|uniref:Hydrogenase expression/formation C-terminal domain-containing protein n=1 Tax=Candidatus Thiothrix putei TaxID=3080811 RepID=A0AA95HIK1_9GAMM|nr:MAG: hydrogenase expression/formation C-terminal domain-containing protein [Candidatus Thiothrix putei]